MGRRSHGARRPGARRRDDAAAPANRRSDDDPDRARPSRDRRPRHPRRRASSRGRTHDRRAPARAMSRRPIRTVVHATALIAVVAIAVGACVARTPPRPADVVLIVVDTLRADHVSLYGYPRRTAPALEAFARDAVTYDDAISPGTWTVPSHAALFTGRWPSYAGAERVPDDHTVNLATPINEAAPTLAELLSKAGFHTSAFVANTAYVAR